MQEAYFSGILLAYTASLLGMLGPGANILAVIGTSMSTSRAAGKALAPGVATGSLAWGLMPLFGLTALIALYATALSVIKVTGARYLLVLAFRATYAMAFSTVPAVTFYRRMRRRIDGALGCFFCFASYEILTSRI